MASPSGDPRSSALQRLLHESPAPRLSSLAGLADSPSAPFSFFAFVTELNLFFFLVWQGRFSYAAGAVAGRQEGGAFRRRSGGVVRAAPHRPRPRSARPVVVVVVVVVVVDAATPLAGGRFSLSLFCAIRGGAKVGFPNCGSRPHDYPPEPRTGAVLGTPRRGRGPLVREPLLLFRGFFAVSVEKGRPVRSL